MSHSNARRSLNWNSCEIENTPPKASWKVRDVSTGGEQVSSDKQLKVVLTRADPSRYVVSNPIVQSPRRKVLREQQISELLSQDDGLSDDDEIMSGRASPVYDQYEEPKVFVIADETQDAKTSKNKTPKDKLQKIVQDEDEIVSKSPSTGTRPSRIRTPKKVYSDEETDFSKRKTPNAKTSKTFADEDAKKTPGTRRCSKANDKTPNPKAANLKNDDPATGRSSRTRSLKGTPKVENKTSNPQTPKAEASQTRSTPLKTESPRSSRRLSILPKRYRPDDNSSGDEFVVADKKSSGNATKKSKLDDNNKKTVPQSGGAYTFRERNTAPKYVDEIVPESAYRKCFASQKQIMAAKNRKPRAMPNSSKSDSESETNDQQTPQKRKGPAPNSRSQSASKPKTSIRLRIAKRSAKSDYEIESSGDEDPKSGKQTPSKKKGPAPRLRNQSASKAKTSIRQRSAKKSDSEIESSDEEIPLSKKKVVAPKSRNQKSKTSIRKRFAKSDSEVEPSDEEDSENDFESRKFKNRRQAQSKGTPGKKRVMTPKIPERRIPLPDSVSPLQEAQLRLHVSAVPDNLPCRENEFAEILSFTESKIQDGIGGCMYISGVPGTGKTATVKEVIRQLRLLVDEGSLEKFNFIEINGMRLTEPSQAYVQIWKSLTNGDKVTAEHAKNLLENRFTGADNHKAKEMTVLLVDELDMLWNRKQSVLYNIFEWPTYRPAKLVVLAIANTMDLPERVMINRVSSRVGLTRLTFSPYNHQQLQEIVATRLAGLSVFDKDAIQLVARKVASLSGDARRALDICRRAAELAQRDSEQHPPAKASQQSPRKLSTPSKKNRQSILPPTSLVQLKHVTMAHQEMFCSPKILAIRHCSDVEKMFLRCLVQIFHKTGIEETNVERIFKTTNELINFEGKSVLTEPEIHALVGRLAASRIILIEPGKCGRLDMKIRLNISQDDVTFALQEHRNDE